MEPIQVLSGIIKVDALVQGSGQQALGALNNWHKQTRRTHKALSTDTQVGTSSSRVKMPPAMDPGAHCLPALTGVMIYQPYSHGPFLLCLDFLSDLIWCYL